MRFLLLIAGLLCLGCVGPEPAPEPEPVPVPVPVPQPGPRSEPPSTAPINALVGGDGCLFVARRDGSLQKHRAQGQLFERDLQAEITVCELVGNTLYLAGSGWLVAVDIDGTQLWRLEAGLLGSVVAMGSYAEFLYVADAGARLLRVDTRDGKPAGRMGPHLGRGQMRDVDAARGGVLLGLHSGRLLLLDRAGNELWSRWPEGDQPQRWARFTSMGVVGFGQLPVLYDLAGNEQARGQRCGWAAPLLVVGEDVYYGGSDGGVLRLGQQNPVARVSALAVLGWDGTRLWAGSESGELSMLDEHP